jgi:competence protein ComGC
MKQKGFTLIEILVVVGITNNRQLELGIKKL